MPTDCKERMLIWEAKYRDLAKIKWLITDCSINPNIQDVDGSTPLHIATRYGHPDVVELLLEYGADPNVKDNKGKTPLHIAAINNHVEVAKLLLEHAQIRMREKSMAKRLCTTRRLIAMMQQQEFLSITGLTTP